MKRTASRVPLPVEGGRAAGAVLLAALAAFAAWPASGQPADTVAAERERIRGERAAAEAGFAEAQKSCYGRFAVHDCIDAARRARNATLAGLRAQELSLNEAERKRKAADRLRELDQRQSPPHQEEAAGRRARAAAEQQQRARELADKKESRDRKAAEAAAREPRVPRTPPEAPRPHPPREAHAPKAHGPDAEAAARNRAAFEERQREAAERRARLEKRLAERKKPAAAPLPADPPAP